MSLARVKASPLKKPAAKPARKSRKKKKSYTGIYCVVIASILLLASPFYYGRVLKGVSSSYRWITSPFDKRNINYPLHTSYDIRIPNGYTIHGIDVSWYQGKIDWGKVAKMQERNVRIDFAFIKATEGVLLVDRYFQRNWQQVPKVGLIRGAYHYFKPKKSGAWQANLFLQAVNFESGDLRPVVDIEETGGQSKEELKKNLMLFLDKVEKKVGVKPIIYTGYKFYLDNLNGSFDDYPVWIAHYYRAKPKTGVNWKFWQHSDKARINGIVYKVDMNVFNGSADDLEKLLIP